ncbi:MAG: thiamine pyrophosphate-binding protein [Burkholderiaceae bacterium]|uniref:thiamine pyrophosphate-binding protein n=1 Tax=Castellaniella sp. TaxID=1955812 RepID=UPI0035605615
MPTSSHALLSVLRAHGVDRVFLVPGESYLGILDALNEFPDIDIVTCRHESGAGFMACADGRLTRRAGVAVVSRGPGASNATIALHTAQQDAIPMILIIGQVPRSHLRQEAFQEIDYQQAYGSIAKWVVEVTEPAQLAAAAFKAVRIATTGTPGPVVLVVPEDVQQQAVDAPAWRAMPPARTVADPETLDQLHRLLDGAARPLIIAGNALDAPGGREALLALAEQRQIPVMVSFRRQDLFPNDHPLYAGDLGLANPREQIAALEESDLILALGTRLGDITTQGYTFPDCPWPRQALVHCYPDTRQIGLHFAARVGLACDPTLLARALRGPGPYPASDARQAWVQRLRALHEGLARWPGAQSSHLIFSEVVQAVKHHAAPDAIIAVDAGTFAVPAYQNFSFMPPQRLMAPISGAMGYGVPAAIATQLRHPGRKVVCLVGDGGFMMTGNEMIHAIERQLPIVFILANNARYGSIRKHQDTVYPGRHLGTSLYNPCLRDLAASFGLRSDRLIHSAQVDALIGDAMADKVPRFIEVMIETPQST